MVDDNLALETGPGRYSERHHPSASLPRDAQVPINHCNLPAKILGSITFQQHPTHLVLDGIAELHEKLFLRLDRCDDQVARSKIFQEYVEQCFCFKDLAAAGLSSNPENRANANWLTMLFGWSFDSDEQEGAVLKGWVESRFGLLPRYHHEPLRDFSQQAYLRYLEMRSAGLYGTNALESQLDLLFTYTQYEFQRQQATAPLTLYRGVNRLAEYEILAEAGSEKRVLLNNLSSFTNSRDRASEFGYYILEARVPVQKVFFHCELLPGMLRSEGEYLVIGGVYDIKLETY